MARTTKPQMLDNFYMRCRKKSFTNENLMVISEISSVKTMEKESEEVKEAICWFVESGLFNCNYSKDEEIKYKNILINAGYIRT